jgi:hypothetical protein
MAKAKREHSTRITRPDPALAAIDNHRKLDRTWLDLTRLQEMDSPGVTRCDVDRRYEAAEAAAWKLAETKPTTVAGAAAMSAYITTGPITGLF